MSQKVKATDGRFQLDLHIPKYGRYFIRATDPSGHTSGLIAYFGSWSDNADQTAATTLHLNSDKKSYRVGEKIKVTIPSATGSVAIVSLENGKTYLIDLSDLDRTYLDALYDANGRLKAPRSGDVNPLSALLPIDPDGDGVYDLLGFQRITGLYNADGLGDFMNQLSWRTGAFALVNQWVGIFGTRI